MAGVRSDGGEGAIVITLRPDSAAVLPASVVSPMVSVSRVGLVGDSAPLSRAPLLLMILLYSSSSSLLTMSKGFLA